MQLSKEEQAYWRKRIREVETDLRQRFGVEQRLFREYENEESNADDSIAWAEREGSKDFLLNLEESQRRAFQDIGDAWNRLNNGTFGICENCGRDIPRERLEAIPYTTLCVDCASKAH